MFSLLKPKTRIPPHNGVTNVRLVTHLALIIPEDCGFRVGNDTRQWVPGRAWVFDDTIEHEAWNESDKLRVVLIFDIWHPHLTPPERALITALTAGVNAFSGGSGGADLKGSKRSFPQCCRFCSSQPSSIGAHYDPGCCRVA
jgi:aspartate beta-hydroxylase